jgi:hypothetical protein
VMRAPMRSVWSAIAEGVGAIAAPFAGLSDVTWLASPWRDQFALAQDFWTAIEHPEVRVIYALVHPDQERLFDPSDVGA